MSNMIGNFSGRSIRDVCSRALSSDSKHAAVRAYLVSVAGVIVLALLALILHVPDHLHLWTIAFLLPVFAGAYLRGVGPGLVATGTATGVLALLFLTPFSGLPLPQSARQTIFYFALNGIVLSLFSEALHRYHRRVEASLLEKWELQERSERELANINGQLTEALEQLRCAQQQMLERERLHALGEMAAGIAHDFNNALGPIVGFSDLLLEKPELRENRELLLSQLRLINLAAQDATSIVSRLREFYRRREQDEAFVPIRPHELVREAIELTRPRWQGQAEARGVTISVETDLREVPFVMGNPAEMREVVMNLVLNAIDSMPNGGRLRLSTRQQDQKAVLEVADTGTGMSEETRRRCLEPFFTTKQGNGTGLGLSVVHGIVRRHGGSIDIQSTLGQGTVFVITVPLSEPQAVPRLELVEAPPSTLRILVVDDQPDCREVLAACLSVDRHEVKTAYDGPDALTQFSSGDFDLVITDHAMPGMSGETLAHAIKQQSATTPVILLTGFGELGSPDSPADSAVDLILTKPISVAGLRQALHQITRSVSRTRPRQQSGEIRESVG